MNKTYTENSKEVKSDNFYYDKVKRAITIWEPIEKRPLYLLQY